MRILALETTERIGSAAALRDDNLLMELTLDPALRSARSLLPAVRDLLAAVGWQPQDVQLVAVSIGPGSFTGLRVGVTAAKVFAYCVGADVMAVSTLETIAAAALEGPPAVAGGEEVSVVVDAQRGDVILQSFTLNPPVGVEPLGAQELVAAETWLAGLAPGAMITGAALGRLAARLPPGVRALDAGCWRPRAAVVGRLAARYHARGRRDDLWKLVPRYFRPSAAEEKWNAMGKP